MSNGKKSVLLCGILLFGIFNISAEVITIDEALDMAKTNSYSIVSAENDLDNSELQKRHSWSTFLPALSLSNTLVSTGSVEDYADSNIFTDVIEGSVTLGLSGAVFDTLDSYSLNAKSSELALKSVQSAISTQTQSLFYYLIASAENIAIQEEALELAEKQYEQMQVNFRNGYASEMQVLQAQLAMENVKPQISQAVLSYEENMMNFKDLIGVSHDVEIQLEGELVYTEVELDADELINQYLAGRLDVQLYTNIIDIQENALDLQKRAAIYPVMSLGVSYSQTLADLTEVYPTSSSVTHEWEDDLSLSLYFSWDPEVLIPGSSTWLDIEAQEVEVENAGLDLQDTVDSAAREIRKAVLNLNSYADTLEVSKISVELSEKSYEMSNDGFKKGTIEILELEDARQDLNSSRQNLLNAVYQYKSGLISLASSLNIDVETLVERYGK